MSKSCRHVAIMVCECGVPGSDGGSLPADPTPCNRPSNRLYLTARSVALVLEAHTFTRGCTHLRVGAHIYACVPVRSSGAGGVWPWYPKPVP